MANPESSRVTVGIDGYNLSLPNGTGLATYGRTLAAAVATFGYNTLGLFGIDPGSDPALQEILFFDRLKRPQIHPRWRRWLRSRIKQAASPALVEIALGKVDVGPLSERLPKFDRIATAPELFQAGFRHFRNTGKIMSLQMADPPEIMHWTCPLPLLLKGARNIYSVHDLVPMHMPYMTLDDKRLNHGIVSACVAAADHLCLVSQTSERELLAMFPDAVGKSTVTYQACDLSVGSESHTVDEDCSLVERLGLRPRRYFLFYGAVEPKKNVARLIEAHAGLLTDTPLVIVTGRSWNDEAERDMIQQLSGQGKLIVMQYLTGTILAALVRQARALAFPSLHEGFGLPVLEAMQLGTAVLTSNRGATVEVAGDAGVLVDPTDVQSIRRGLALLDGDSKFRSDQVAQGLKQAELFSPERYAARLSETYSRILDMA